MIRLAVKRLAKFFFMRPIGLQNCGLDSRFRRPWEIRGARYISIGKDVLVLQHAFVAAYDSYAGVRHNPKLEIGDGSYIGRYSYITCAGKITIGDNCVISEQVYISDNSHGLDPVALPILRQPLIVKSVSIGRRSFLGYRAAIMPGVELGEHCVVGAHSVVTRSFPAYSMIGGTPARLLKTYSEVLGQWSAVAPNCDN